METKDFSFTIKYLITVEFMGDIQTIACSNEQDCNDMVEDIKKRFKNIGSLPRPNMSVNLKIWEVIKPETLTAKLITEWAYKVKNSVLISYSSWEWERVGYYSINSSPFLNTGRGSKW